MALTQRLFHFKLRFQATPGLSMVFVVPFPSLTPMLSQFYSTWFEVPNSAVVFDKWI